MTVKQNVLALSVVTKKNILQFVGMMGRRMQVNVNLRKHLVTRNYKSKLSRRQPVVSSGTGTGANVFSRVAFAQVLQIFFIIMSEHQIPFSAFHSLSRSKAIFLVTQKSPLFQNYGAANLLSL